ncbi:MAG TPA: lysoplasmalogenase [Candidatus Nanopelagicales bacterium]
MLVLTWGTYLAVRLLQPGVPLERVLKGLLMPALLVWVLARVSGPAPKGLVLGLVLATVGDIAIDVNFIAGMLGFLGMQLCYIAGFVGLGAAGALRRRWPIALAYAGIWAGANLVLGPALGDLRLPVLVYSLAICVMAALGCGVNATVGLGAALFLISDALIAVDRAGLDLPLGSALVMPTYLAGQYWIASGWVRALATGGLGGRARASALPAA